MNKPACNLPNFSIDWYWLQVVWIKSLKSERLACNWAIWELRWLNWRCLIEDVTLEWLPGELILSGGEFIMVLWTKSARRNMRFYDRWIGILKYYVNGGSSEKSMEYWSLNKRMSMLLWLYAINETGSTGNTTALYDTIDQLYFGIRMSFFKVLLEN